MSALSLIITFEWFFFFWCYDYFLSFSCCCQELNAVDYFTFPLHKGFPVQISGELTTSVVVADVENDGWMELCFNVDGKTHLLRQNGLAYNAAWPKEGGYRTPAIVDIDGDGEKEIVSFGPGTEMSAWKLDGSLVSGWPHAFHNNGYAYDTLAIMDLDRNTTNEITVGFGYNGNFLSILHPDGTDLIGFPVEVAHNNWYSPGLVDLDSDGTYEVLVGHDDYNADKVVAYDIHGNHFQGDWLVELGGLGLGGVRSNITIADIDGDKRPEIMFGTDVSRTEGHIDAVVLNHDRTFATGWPKVVHSWVYGGLSAGDIDGDGKLEVAGVTGGNYDASNNFFSRLYVWNGEDGSDLQGFPKDLMGGSDDCTGQGVIIGDVDGDCDQEILLACYDQLTSITGLYAFHYSGAMVSGFPLLINGYITLWNNNVFLADIDNDGLVEIGIGLNNGGSVSRIYVWDLPYPYNPKCQEWPQYRHDCQHTGNYHFPEGLPIIPPVPELSMAELILLLFLFSLSFYATQRTPKKDQQSETLTRTE